MARSVELSVVVPVKDEAGNVAPLAREIAAALEGGPDYEMIFVDDGSTDTTVDELRGLRPALPVRVLKHSRNLGQSRALRTGIRAARSDVIVTLDGDGQNDPTDIPKLLSLFRSEASRTSFAMVAGERAKRRDNFSKRLASRIGNGLRRRLLGDNANDTGCGLKVFRRDAFLALPYFDHMHRYLIALMLREGLEVRFMAVNHRPRGRGHSKYGVLDRAFVGASDLLGVMWLKRRFRKSEGTPKEL
ncbi:MAG TPA: glycosyltransferase family 2 protein [Micropepsaceae bacterium]|jgi:dolichol-phosphate mannosyltransferase|nr:glycosyltransferase family 2 protein [Micropepsaceae bacterium]